MHRCLLFVGCMLHLLQRCNGMLLAFIMMSALATQGGRHCYGATLLLGCKQGAAAGAVALHPIGDQARGNDAALQQEKSLAHSLAAQPAGLGGHPQDEAAHADQAPPQVSTSDQPPRAKAFLRHAVGPALAR